MSKCFRAPRIKMLLIFICCCISSFCSGQNKKELILVDKKDTAKKITIPLPFEIDLIFIKKDYLWGTIIGGTDSTIAVCGYSTSEDTLSTREHTRLDTTIIKWNDIKRIRYPNKHPSIVKKISASLVMICSEVAFIGGIIRSYDHSVPLHERHDDLFYALVGAGGIAGMVIFENCIIYKFIYPRKWKIIIR